MRSALPTAHWGISARCPTAPPASPAQSSPPPPAARHSPAAPVDPSAPLIDQQRRQHLPGNHADDESRRPSRGVRTNAAVMYSTPATPPNHAHQGAWARLCNCGSGARITSSAGTSINKLTSSDTPRPTTDGPATDPGRHCCPPGMARRRQPARQRAMAAGQIELMLAA